jgi:hypothetical protein
VNDDSTVAYPTLAVIGTNVAGNQALRPHSRHQEVFHARDARAAGSVARGRSPTKPDDPHCDISLLLLFVRAHLADVASWFRRS